MGIIDTLKKETKKPAAAKTKKASTVKVEKAEEKAVATTTETAVTGSISTNTLSVIVKPLVTEKAAILQTQNKYVFVVEASANKQQIVAAIKEMYKVDATDVHVIHNQGHRVRFGKSNGRHSDFKKAIVTLPKGAAITIHAGV